ncbi:hypothetical protein E1A91_A08G105000v1 [Gossypium mustelinum]|uniref:Uncharacterized protein n=1 Tax=Gossypium mustelinum TaxID=34275 RepID=A0A5D2Y736_GOSMU|nr:hypothetical protein E1A91_A08G105000v1 [Gossypium mustelinum]
MASTAKAEGCPERGMKSRIRVDFQTVFVQGSPPLIPNRASKKLYLCHIQFRKVHPDTSNGGTVTEDVLQSFNSRQAPEHSRRLYRLKKLGMILRNICHVVIFILEDSCKFHNLVKNGLYMS